MQVKTFGLWKSPFTPEFVTQNAKQITSQVQVDADDIYFIEQRPSENGRSVLMKFNKEQAPTEVLPKEISVRTKYLEYGGHCFCVHEGTCYFVNADDQNIYEYKNNSLRQVTKKENTRFADLTFDSNFQSLIAVCEYQQAPESTNTVCKIDVNSGEVHDLVKGADFYNSPRLNNDGQLVWLEWNHPNMPWNGTEAFVAPIDNLNAKKKIAGSSQNAVSQIRWGQEGQLYFVAELGEYLNMYSYIYGELQKVINRPNEFAQPDWVPGIQQFAVHNSGFLCSTFFENGYSRIILTKGNESILLKESFTHVSSVHAYSDNFVAMVGFSDLGSAIIEINRQGQVKVLHSEEPLTISADYISQPQQFNYPTEEGSTGFAWFYPPKNKDYKGPDNTKPPLIVMAHGGPTGMSKPTFRKDIQYWTSQGFAIVDVNYGGSTGYGKTYRERLSGNWGKVDVSDCVAAVQKLVEQGLVDKGKVAIRGGSAGGYTTLAALTFTEGVFAVGASYFGVSDVELLAKETHKFESRYMDQLIGPYPESQDEYDKRSPIKCVDQLNCPILFLQGDEDKIVPPNQSELMYKSLLKKGIQTEYKLYKGEGHGFRRSETRIDALVTEYNFYKKVLNIID